MHDEVGDVSTVTVAVMRPMLPTADKLTPYLRRIDGNRIYSNYGPLTIEFQNRLSDHLGMPLGSIVSASCGTTALIGAVLATAGAATPKRPVAIIPAFTFAATAAAVQRCGYQPYFVDVDADSWALKPDQLINHPLSDQIGVVVPVAPFGRPVFAEPWLNFQKRTKIPVVIDAAASFDCISEAPGKFVSEIPVVLSFHATKTFATGEGGCVISTNIALVDSVAQALNFGFNMSRDSASASINGKMSEYHAAVGLAEFDGWAAKQKKLQSVIQNYRSHLSKAGLLSRFISWPDISATYALFDCLSASEADCVQKKLEQVGVGFRFWYGTGLHRQTYYSKNPRNDLEVTENIARRLIGIPMACDLTDDAIARVIAGISAGTMASRAATGGSISLNTS